MYSLKSCGQPFYPKKQEKGWPQGFFLIDYGLVKGLNT
jgi:hypothetical protein